jgi:hypothetical protein
MLQVAVAKASKYVSVSLTETQGLFLTHLQRSFDVRVPEDLMLRIPYSTVPLNPVLFQESTD